MRRLRTGAAVPFLLCLGAYAIAFLQRPGLASTDTKINLYVSPGRFLGDVASMWTSSGQLGDVQSGQYTGYLFPMGPFFAVGHSLGLSPWVLQRLWLGTLLALTAWGVVRLLDDLLGGRRGVAALIAGAAAILNPLVVTYANRSTVTLLAYVVLPWLLLAVHRGVRETGGSGGLRRWRWPAACGLLLTASGPGINAAVTAWMLLGPLLLLLYELRYASVRGADARSFLIRTVALTLLVSLWWLIPAYIQSSYGIDFLHFTEQPGTVWGTTSITESLRLMSFWLSYVGIGFTGHAIPYFDDAHTLLFSLPVVTATLLVPGLALAGFGWTRRWAYGPFFLGLALLGLLVMGAGFPDGTPLRHGLTFTYNHVAAVRFLRASYKAAPLVAISTACLAGVAGGELWRRLARTRRVHAWRLVMPAAVGALLALSAWPLVQGHAQDAQTSFRRIPQPWRAAAAGLDRELPPNSRAIVLPGDLFSFYRWGGTVDPILPALTRRPVAERTEVPYADLRATDLLWTVDALVHQQRLLPGQLGPLLNLIGVRSVVTGADADLARSDAPPAADVARELMAQPGFERPARNYGPVRSFAPTGAGDRLALPQVRRYDLAAARPLVRVEPLQAPTIVDGSAQGLSELAAFGALPARRPLLYAADLTPAQLRSNLAQGGEVDVTDTNRRRAFVAGSLDQNVGPTLTTGENVSADGLVLDPFAGGPGAQTVAQYSGAVSVHAPESPQVEQFPEHAAFAAVDGSTHTSWLADPDLEPGRRWLEVDFPQPRTVPYVDLMPYAGPGGSVRAVQIEGHGFAVHPGWNHLRLGRRPVRALRVVLSEVTGGDPTSIAAAGGISELRIPGVRVGEALRTPQDAYDALRGHDVSRVTLSYLFERTTGDYPFQRDPAAATSVPSAQTAHAALGLQQVGDQERGNWQRTFDLPAARRFTASAWLTVSPLASDPQLDRLAGYHGSVQASSSSRLDGLPGARASRALDGDPGTAWIGDWQPGRPAWLSWRSPRPVTVSTLRLLAPVQPVRRPTEVRLVWDGNSSAVLPVDASGRVSIGRTVRARRVRIEVLAARAPAGASAAAEKAVGIAEVQGIAGLTRVAGGSGEVAGPCGSARLQLGASVVELGFTAPRAAFEQGTPLNAHACGPPVALAAGSERLAVAPGPLEVDDVRLLSPAPLASRPVPAGGGLVGPGHMGRGVYGGIRLQIHRASWLVLGEGYNRGWQAWCDGRSLGRSMPIDGYANGWRVPAGCRSADLRFAPNRLAGAGYLISGLVGLICLLALVPLRSRRRWTRRLASADAPLVGHRMPASRSPARAPVPRALLAAMLLALPFGFVFGLRAGIVSVPVTAVILWRGIGAGGLSAVAGVLLVVVVPLLYLIQAPASAGGNDYAYATEHLDAHWAGVAAFGLLAAALWRTLRTRGAPERPSDRR